MNLELIQNALVPKYPFNLCHFQLLLRAHVSQEGWVTKQFTWTGSLLLWLFCVLAPRLHLDSNCCYNLELLPIMCHAQPILHSGMSSLLYQLFLFINCCFFKSSVILLHLNLFCFQTGMNYELWPVHNTQCWNFSIWGLIFKN